MHMRSYVRVSVLSLFATGVVVYFVVAVVVLYTRIFCKMRMYMDVHRTLTMSGNAVQICLPHFGFSTRRELLCVCVRRWENRKIPIPPSCCYVMPDVLPIKYFLQLNANAPHAIITNFAISDSLTTEAGTHIINLRHSVVNNRNMQ